ncbi:ABC-F family ATP-binding cassette domain-containing protein [bacterium]|nr:ABC-F family ATP-binding cassette domain-containing protein [bacterium]
MALLEFSGIAYGYSDERVIVEATAALHAGNIVGLIGANGGGKTTLLRVLLNELKPEEGQVQHAKSMKLAYVSQTAGGTDEDELFTFVKRGRQDLLELQAEQDRLHERLAAEAGNAELIDRLGRAEARFSALGGHRWEHDVERLLLGLSFRRAEFSKRLGTLSGGQRQKACLARALLSDSNCLVFDEPTNHLDLAAQAFFVDYLRGLPRETAVVLVSHDRWLLDNLATHIWELDGGVLYRYPGNYSKYVPLRDERRKQARIAYERQQEHIARTEEYIRRNIAGQNTRQARGRRKILGRMERVERPAEDPEMRFFLQPALRSGEQLLIVENLSFGYGVETGQLPPQKAEQVHVAAGAKGLSLNPPLTVARSAVGGELVVSGFNLQFYRGERLGIIGPNGCGKTTLLKLLAKTLPLQRGMIAWGTNAELGIFSQDSADLTPGRDVMAELRAVEPTISDSAARDYLARFGFSGDDVFALVETLSGGERSRLTLAKIFRCRPNVLLFDEPTNHLDIYAREALEQFLNSYAGSVIMVTHDRALLERICDRLVVFPYGAEDEQALTVFRGSYSDYLTWRERAGTAPPPADPQPKPSGGGKADPAKPESLSIYDIELLARDARTSVDGYIAKQLQRVEAKAEAIEDEIAALEDQTGELQQLQGEAAARQEYDRLAELQSEIDGLTAEINGRFSELEELQPVLDAWKNHAARYNSAQ